MLEQKVKQLEELIYGGKYLNKYFTITYHGDSYYYKVNSISGDMLSCDVLQFNKRYNPCYSCDVGQLYHYINGKLIENQKVHVNKFSNYTEINKSEFNSMLKSMIEQKFK